jgi:regulator of protease activity HflC (stomatin/prohibitin superfamily)
MNRQMTAERERRATVTQAEGERQAAIMVAEGEKQAAILRAEGQKESAILQAQGERQAQELKAEGFAMALQAIYAQAQHVDNKTMALQYLDALRAMGASPSTKFILPMELTSLMSQFVSTMNSAGSNGAAGGEREAVSRDVAQ